MSNPCFVLKILSDHVEFATLNYSFFLMLCSWVIGVFLVSSLVYEEWEEEIG